MEYIEYIIRSHLLQFHLSFSICGHHFVVAAMDIRIGPVHQIQIDIVESKVLQRLAAGILHPLRLMEVTPELRSCQFRK